MNEDMERIYGEAIDLLEQGVSVEAILARYPANEADLRPFLRTAAALATLATQPSLTAEQQSKRAFLAAASGPVPAARRSSSAGWLRRLLAPVLAVLLVVFLGGAALAGASGSAMPGSALYGTKRLVEDVRLGLAADPERAAALRERFRQERVREVERLLANGATAEVMLSGEIEAIAPDATGQLWTVAGQPVLVTAATQGEGVAGVGSLVEVEGRTANGVLRATQFRLLSGALPAPTPSTPPTVAPTPAPAASDTPAATPTGQVTPTATATPPATATASPSPAATVAPATLPPSPTPGDDNANDNGGDDNANDNDDNGNGNDNGGDDNANDNDDNGGDDNNSGDDNANDNDDNGGDDQDDSGGDVNDNE